MSKSYFIIKNTQQENEINTPTAKTNGNGPVLTIPISISLKNIEEKPQTKFVLNYVSATLRIVGLSNSDLTITLPLSMDIDNCSQSLYYFEFSLSKSLINKIEEQRKSDAFFELKLDYHLSHYLYLQNAGQPNACIFLKAARSTSELKFTIAQSDWVKNFLPNFGYQACEILELPLKSNISPNIFPKATTEFQAGFKYFTNGDYDKAVSQCRIAIEPIKNDLPKISQRIQSKSESDWYKKFLEASISYLETTIGATYSFSSKAHHNPSIGHFNRKTAESILLITGGLLNFAAQISEETNI